MNTKLLWAAVLALTLIVVYQGATAYQPDPVKPKTMLLNAPAGTYTNPQTGQKFSVLMLFMDDGTTAWSAQPIEEKPVLQLGK